MKRTLFVAVVVAIATLGACDLPDGTPAIKVSGPRSVGGVTEELIGGETINFGEQTSGDHQELSFAIQNIGTSTLRLVDTGSGYVELVNNADGVFSVAVQPSTDELDPNDVVIFTLRFTAGPGGTYTAKILLRSDDPDDQTLEFNLTGESPMPL